MFSDSHRELAGQLRGRLHEPSKDIAPPRAAARRASVVWATGSGAGSIRATTYGSVPTEIQKPDALEPLDHQHARCRRGPARADGSPPHGADLVEVVRSGGLRLRGRAGPRAPGVGCRASRRRRARTERGCPTASGAAVSGNTTASRSGRTGSASGNRNVAAADPGLDGHQPDTRRFGSVMRSRPRS